MIADDGEPDTLCRLQKLKDKAIEALLFIGVPEQHVSENMAVNIRGNHGDDHSLEQQDNILLRLVKFWIRQLNEIDENPYSDDELEGNGKETH